MIRFLPSPVFYGVFSDTVDQTLSAANTPQTVTINTTDASSGVIIGAPTSRVICTHPGVYNFQFSIQFESNNASLKNIVIWCRVNGVDIPNSASDISISGSGTQLIAAWNFVLPMVANDYFELVWACDNANIQMAATPAQTTPYVRPAIPSLILTVTQVN